MPEATFKLRLLGAFSILISAIIGLILQIILAFTLYKGWNTFKGNSFYLITVQLMWCDVCALILDLYVAFPLILTGVQVRIFERNYMGDSILFYYGPLFFEGIAFNGIFLLSFFLTTNRFLLFVCQRLHAKLFTIRGTKIMSALVWIYVFVFMGLSNVFGCTKQFSKEYFYFWYNCSKSVPGKFHFKNYMDIQGYSIPCAMLLMYFVIYVKIRMTTYGTRIVGDARVKREIRYLVQTILICFLLGVEIIAFITIPFLNVSGYTHFYLNILLNLLLVINNLTTPVVLLAFNWEIRKFLRIALHLRRSCNPVTSLSVALSRKSRT
ncbi:hypothetical protein RB195_003461 [Necator americanus]|uniref:G-protein coupled receptors family 1 profile domain-containing protein n=1 Tax=Necator americanus TaxID=51031 RepID=A0ABR1DNN2_NECAM